MALLPGLSLISIAAAINLWSRFLGKSGVWIDLWQIGLHVIVQPVQQLQDAPLSGHFCLQRQVYRLQNSGFIVMRSHDYLPITLFCKICGPEGDGWLLASRYKIRHVKARPDCARR